MEYLKPKTTTRSSSSSLVSTQAYPKTRFHPLTRRVPCDHGRRQTIDWLFGSNLGIQTDRTDYFTPHWVVTTYFSGATSSYRIAVWPGLEDLPTTSRSITKVNILKQTPQNVVVSVLHWLIKWLSFIFNWIGH